MQLPQPANNNHHNQPTTTTTTSQPQPANNHHHNQPTTTSTSTSQPQPANNHHHNQPTTTSTSTSQQPPPQPANNNHINYHFYCKLCSIHVEQHTCGSVIQITEYLLRSCPYTHRDNIFVFDAGKIKHCDTCRGFRTRMVHLNYITCLRYTILVWSPRCAFAWIT